MCPTVLGRLETRVAILVGPAILGALLSLVTGEVGFIVMIGIYLLEGVALDVGFYPFVIRWQPPWLTFTLAVGEFVILVVLAMALDVGLELWQAIVWFWVAWTIAIVTKIVVLPIVSLSWIEDGGEFRRTGWSISPEQAPISIVAPIAEPAMAGPPPLAREFSSVHEIPVELRDLPSPSGIHRVPELD